VGVRLKRRASLTHLGSKRRGERGTHIVANLGEGTIIKVLKQPAIWGKVLRGSSHSPVSALSKDLGLEKRIISSNYRTRGGVPFRKKVTIRRGILEPKGRYRSWKTQKVDLKKVKSIYRNLLASRLRASGVKGETDSSCPKEPQRKTLQKRNGRGRPAL